MTMTADEDRDRVGDIRAGAARVMRAVCRPKPDWKAAEEVARECVIMCAALENQCFIEGRRERTSHGGCQGGKQAAEDVREAHGRGAEG